MIGKILLIGFLIVVVIILVAGIIVSSVFDYNKENDSTAVNLNEEDKSALKEFAGKIKKWIYREATIHNPEGDVLPDELDDEIIKELRNRIR